jgi:predicted ATPase
MKLISLYIDDYKLLKKFNINFKKEISILIGINGSGKSTILEAIAQIFSDAVLEQKSKFGFKLIYELRLKNIINSFSADYVKVEISAEKKGCDLIYKLYITDKIVENKEDIKNELKDFNKIFPSNVVIYYSGLSDIMKNICIPHDEELSKQYRKWNLGVYRPFFYFEPALLDIALISLLSYEYGDIPKFLFDRIKIKKLQSIRIRLKKPAWAKQKIDKWWGAEGEVKAFLDFLDSIGMPLIIDENVPKKGRFGNVVIEAFQDEYLIITIIDQEKLLEIREYFTEEKALFKMLNTLYIDGFWLDATFSFIKDENGVTNSFSILSEGEQQSIIIKGLTELVTSDNTLFLFDEPDTYLHPSWQRNFIKEIVDFMEDNYNISSQFLITTHSPLLLSNADSEKSEVKIMEDGEIIKLTPKYYGKDISTILYELMGVERRNKEITKRLGDFFNLIEDEELEAIKKEYDLLAELLGEDDPALVQAKIQIGYLEEGNHEKDS